MADRSGTCVDEEGYGGMEPLVCSPAPTPADSLPAPPLDAANELDEDEEWEEVPEGEEAWEDELEEDVPENEGESMPAAAMLEIPTVLPNIHASVFVVIPITSRLSDT